MKFCNKCKNILYIIEDKLKKKIYKECKNCKLKIPCKSNCIFEYSYKNKKLNNNNPNNQKYINYDKSYPRKINKCPNCKKENLNAYYQNNKFNLINICKNCNYYWKNNN